MGEKDLCLDLPSRKEPIQLNLLEFPDLAPECSRHPAGERVVQVPAADVIALEEGRLVHERGLRRPEAVPDVSGSIHFHLSPFLAIALILDPVKLFYHVHNWFFLSLFPVQYSRP